MKTKKNLFGISLFLFVFTILSFSIVSANNADLEEFLWENVTQITVTVTQDDSWVDFFLNTSGTSFDHQDIRIENEVIDDITINKLSLSFNISEILNDINAEVEIREGSNIVQFKSLDVSDGGLIKITDFEIDGDDGYFILPEGWWLLSPTNSFFQRIFDKLEPDINISNITTINNFLAENPPSITEGGQTVFSDRNINFTKEGNDYAIWNDQGFGEIPAEWELEIRDAIEFGVESVSLDDIFDVITPFLQENGVDSIFDGLDMNYTIGGIDLSNIVLEDGTYIVSVPVEKDGIIYPKKVTLILQGIEHEEEAVVTDGTYSPSSQEPEIKDVLSNITGLIANNITVKVFDSFNSKPANTNAFKYLEITTDIESSADINFKLKTTLEVINPENIHLYRLHDGIWTKLDTQFLGTSGGFYAFTAQTPGFSIFLIAEEEEITPPRSGGGRSSRRNDEEDELEIVPDVQPTPLQPQEPIELETPEEDKGFFSTITGAVTGVLGTGGPIVVIMFIISVIGLTVVLRIKRKATKSKGKKVSKELNIKGDKNEP